MRIRQLVLHNFRDFGEVTAVSFVDPRTDHVRPVTAIAGPNEAAKATVLEAIDALLSYAVDPRHPKPLIHEAMAGGLVRLELELTASDLEHLYQQPIPPDAPRSRVLKIEVGRQGVAPQVPVREWSTLLACLAPRGSDDAPFTNAGALSSLLLSAVSRMRRGGDLHGGLLYFPGLDDGDGQPGTAPATGFTWATAPDARPVAAADTRAWIVRTSVDELRSLDAAADGGRRAGGHDGWQAGDPADAGSDFGGVSGAATGTGGGAGDVGAAGDAPEAAIWETQALPIFGVLRERQRPGAVIAIDQPAIPRSPERQRRVINRLRRVAEDLDAQVILAVRSDDVLQAFAEDERVVLG
ncbi:hypothetical protein DCC79_07345 [bacterium]|nr:MAG: hypothetical protein DCC79_07345 [bacterium]